MAIEVTTTKTIACNNCGSDAVVKFGTYKGVQRYYCKVCKRKYTDLASKHFKDYHPQVGDVWVADDTMLDVDGQHKLWFYDIIDTKTRYLLASRVALSRTTHDAETLMREAHKRAGKTPKQVITDQNYSYLDGIEKAFGADTEHVQGSPFKAKTTGESTSQIERFHGTLKDRTKVIRAFRDFETLKQFTDGWLVYYNYFKPRQSLNGKTPAEQANVNYAVKNWLIWLVFHSRSKVS